MKRIIIFTFLFFVLVANSIVKAQVSTISNPLDLENVKTVPDKIYAGSNFILGGTLRNVADRTLTNARFTVQGGFPFSKTSPTSSFYIGDLIPNQTFQFSIPLSIDNDATDQQYALQMKANYEVWDPTIIINLNVIYSEILTATVKVDKGVDIEIVNATFPQPIIPDVKEGKIILYVKNIGINSAEQVQLNLAAEYPFIPSGKSYFIDEIKPGKIKAATFHVDVDSSAAVQTFPLDVTISWKEGNNRYSDTKTFGIPVGAGKSIFYSLLGLIQMNSFIKLILIIAVLVVAGFIFRRRRKRRSK